MGYAIPYTNARDLILSAYLNGKYIVHICTCHNLFKKDLCSHNFLMTYQRRIGIVYLNNTFSLQKIMQNICYALAMNSTNFRVKRVP